MACILPWSSAVKVHDSQAYRKMYMTRKRISRISELRETLLVIRNWLQPCQCCCCLYYPGEYLRLGTLISYNWAQVLEACDCPKPLSIHFDLLLMQLVLFVTPEGRPGMSDVSPLSGISRLSFDATLLSPLLFFCLVLLPFLSYRFLPAGPFF